MTVLQGPQTWFAAETRKPRSEFGQRKPRDFTRAMREAREADRRMALAARRAAEELAGGSQKRASVHPDLQLALAARVEGFAAMARGLAVECRANGHLRHQVTLSDLADILELMACEIEAEVRS
jgi:hypothetical protein